MKKQNKEEATTIVLDELPQERINSEEMREVYWKIRHDELLDVVLDVIEKEFVQQLILGWRISLGENTLLPSIVLEEWNRIKKEIKIRLQNQQEGHNEKNIRNLVVDSKGKFKSLNYKTFKGMVSQLRKTNKNLKKFGLRVEYLITLPIK